MSVAPIDPGDEAAIRAALSTYVSAALEQDWSTFVDVFDPDPLCMPAGVPALRSRDAIHGFYASFPPLDALSLVPESFEAAGALVLEAGSYAFRAGEFEDRGKYLHVWRRHAEGGWRLYRNIANSDGSPTEA